MASSTVGRQRGRGGLDAAWDQWPGDTAVNLRDSSRWTSRWNAGLVVLGGVLIAVLGYERRFICDDGLIYTRTVREILAGNGPNFSPGERAEASTSTAWQWLLALLGWVSGADVARLAVATGLVLTVAGFAVALDGSRRMQLEQGGRLLLPGGVALLLALPPVWDYATSGLETGLATFWMASCWWLLVTLRPGHRAARTFLTTVALGLGPLVRPDLALVSMVFLWAGWCLGRPPSRRAAAALLATGALPVAYEIFRMGYYGVLQPLPGLTKEAGAADWSRGVGYVENFIGPYWLYLGLPLALVLLLSGHPDGAASRYRMLRLAPCLSGGLLALYVVRVGGDWMQARMLLPALFLVMLPVLVVPASRRTAATLALLAVWSGLTLSSIPSPYLGQAGQPLEALTHHTALDVHRSVVQFSGVAHPVSGRDYLPEFADHQRAVQKALASGRSTLLLFHDVGGTPRLYPVELAGSPNSRTLVVAALSLGATGELVPLDERVVDQLSLAYPLGAHLQLQRSLFAGHEKWISNAWILADYVLASVSPVTKSAGVTPAEVSAARSALRCGQLRELQESVRAPLTLARFWENVVGAPRRTALRVPRDPRVAVRRFCGVG